MEDGSREQEESNGLVAAVGKLASKSGLGNLFHSCTPMTYEPTGEVLKFYREVPWSFLQEFTVCEDRDCRRVNVLRQVNGDDGAVYPSEKDGTKWSGYCDYAKVPSIGRDKLRLNE